MIKTGIVRDVDELGRIVIPVEIRRNFDIKPKDPIEIYVDGETIMLKKFEVACAFCGEREDLTVFKGKNVCSNCLADLRK